MKGKLEEEGEVEGKEGSEGCMKVRRVREWESICAVVSYRPSSGMP